MILFLNVFITDQAFTSYDRGIVGPPVDRLDVFKYSLASLAVLPWSGVFINAELDSNYLSRKDELEHFVQQHFERPHLDFKRNLFQSQWKSNLETVLSNEDSVICFLCNDDHVFIDSSLDGFLLVEKKMKSLIQDGHRYCSSYISHWPEMMSYMGRNQHELDQRNIATKDNPYYPKIFDECNEYAVGKWHNIDSVQLVSKDLLRHWWFENDYGDVKLARSDAFGDVGVKTHPDQVCVFPKRELLRHFDGYSHAMIDINRCPPLIIPPGFFDGAIRISYGAQKRIPDFFHLNPLIENYCFVDPEGVDMRGVLEDLPLFWRTRIGSIDEYGPRDYERELRARNEAVLRLASPRLPWTCGELCNKFPAALRVDPQGRGLPTSSDFLDSVSVQYPRVYYRVKSNRPPPQLSMVLLDAGEVELEESLKTLRNEARDLNIEIVLASVRTPPEFRSDWARVLKGLADIIVVQKQPLYNKMATFHAHEVLNSALKESKGSYTLIGHVAFRFSREFLNRLMMHLEIAQGFEQIVLPYDVISVDQAQKHFGGFIARRSAIMDLGGLDESHVYLGKAWSLKELFDRAVEKEKMEAPKEHSPLCVSSSIEIQAPHLPMQRSTNYSPQPDWSYAIDLLSLALASGDSTQISSCIQKLHSMHRVVSSRFYQDVLVPMLRGDMSSVVRYFEANLQGCASCELTMFAALLIQMQQLDAAWNLLQSSQQSYSLCVVPLLLQAMIAPRVAPHESEHIDKLLKMRFPHYELILKGQTI